MNTIVHSALPIIHIPNTLYFMNQKVFIKLMHSVLNKNNFGI